MRNTLTAFITLLFLQIIPSYVLAQSRIEVEEPICEFKNISKGEVIEKIFKIKNTGSEKLIINKVRPSCDCISAIILKNEAEKGEYAEVKAILDTNSKEVKNNFIKYIYVQSNDSNNPVVRITIKGVLAGNQKSESINENIHKLEKDSSGRVEVLLFYSQGCKGCTRVKDIFLTALEKQYKGNIIFRNYEIDIMDNYLKLIELENKYGVKENDPMIVFAGDKYFSGEESIIKGLESYLKELMGKEVIKNDVVNKLDKEILISKFNSFNPFIIASAGFIDGLNPCAFVTIVFLISFLCFNGRNRREILITGLLFAFAVFLAYFLIGLGVRSVLNKILIFNAVSKIIYFLAVILLVILAFYSFYDAIIYLKFKDNKRIKIKLPELIIQKIHNIIRNKFNDKAIFLSVFIAGFFISLLESICTGQLYLPTIMYMMKIPNAKVSSLMYLLLYNIAFIIPLMAVTVFAFLGVSSKVFTSFSRKNIFITKISIAFLFLLLAILLVYVG